MKKKWCGGEFKRGGWGKGKAYDKQTIREQLGSVATEPNPPVLSIFKRTKPEYVLH